MGLTLLRTHREAIYAATRMVIGFLFALHGGQKLFGWFGGPPGPMPPAMLYGVGGLELIGGALIAIGWGTRPLAFLCSGLMAGAYFMVHQPKGLLPIQNHGELAVLYCWTFLLLAANGNGVASVGGRDAI